jgi:hypothetical protein
MIRAALLAAGLALMATSADADPPSVAQQAADAAVVRGLEAQYQAALIRERRLADDREQRLIADAEARLTRARAAADAAAGDAAAIQTELAAARDEYATLVESIAQRDASARAEIDSYRREAENLVARASPEMRRALERFADGDRVGAWPVIEQETQARVRARIAAAEQAAAADLEEIERLRREMQEQNP